MIEWLQELLPLQLNTEYVTQWHLPIGGPMKLRRIAIAQKSLVADPDTGRQCVHTSIKYNKLLSTVQSTVKKEQANVTTEHWLQEVRIGDCWHMCADYTVLQFLGLQPLGNLAQRMNWKERNHSFVRKINAFFFPAFHIDAWCSKLSGIALNFSTPRICIFRLLYNVVMQATRRPARFSAYSVQLLWIFNEDEYKTVWNSYTWGAYGVTARWAHDVQTNGVIMHRPAASYGIGAARILYMCDFFFFFFSWGV